MREELFLSSIISINGVLISVKQFLINEINNLSEDKAKDFTLKSLFDNTECENCDIHTLGKEFRELVRTNLNGVQEISLGSEVHYCRIGSAKEEKLFVEVTKTLSDVSLSNNI
ncbi:MAG: hypothetical protein K2H93_09910 [Oscillospiraceae bacterium]|nr:hypothetical protein [Oscillospiraceae bacterium]